MTMIQKMNFIKSQFQIEFDILVNVQSTPVDQYKYQNIKFEENNNITYFKDMNVENLY